MTALVLLSTANNPQCDNKLKVSGPQVCMKATVGRLIQSFDEDEGRHIDILADFLSGHFKTGLLGDTF